MDIKVGDSLYCKRSFDYEGNGRYCIKGRSYIISGIKTYADSDDLIVDIVPNDKSLKIGVSLNPDCDRENYEYIWDYFVNVERIRKVAKEFVG